MLHWTFLRGAFVLSLLFLKEKVARGFRGSGWYGVRFQVCPRPQSISVQSEGDVGLIERPEMKLTPHPIKTHSVGFGLCNSNPRVAQVLRQASCQALKLGRCRLFV